MRGEILCSDVVGILLDVNHAEESNGLSVLDFTIWDVTNPVLNTNSTQQKLYEGKLNLKTVSERRWNIKLKIRRSKEKHKHLKEQKIAVKLSKVACHLLLHSDQPSTLAELWGIIRNMHCAALVL